MSENPLPLSPQATEIEDEKFNFVGGLGEFLTSIGTFVLFLGLSILLFGLKAGGGISGFVYGNFTMLIGLTLVMSEYITRRKKLVGPSIVLAIVFVMLTSMMFGYYDVDRSVQINGFDIVDNFEKSFTYNKDSSFLPIILAFAAQVLYYLRYKTPFMLLLIAIGSASQLFAAIVMANLWYLDALYAIGVVALAIWYDQKDVARITRKSDCAFWLHLAGAIIFIGAINVPLGFVNNPNGGGAVLFLFVYVALALFAIIINRRAMISTGLVFAAIAIYQLLENMGGINVSITALTLVSIGGMVMALSLWWQIIRGYVMRFMPQELRTRFPIGPKF